MNKIKIAKKTEADFCKTYANKFNNNNNNINSNSKFINKKKGNNIEKKIGNNFIKDKIRFVNNNDINNDVFKSKNFIETFNNNKNNNRNNNIINNNYTDIFNKVSDKNNWELNRDMKKLSVFSTFYKNKIIDNI